MLEVLDEGLPFGAHNSSYCSLNRANELQLIPRIIAVHDVKFYGLMFFEVISDEEALVEVRIKVVINLLSPAHLSPRCLGRVPLLEHYAERIRYALPDPVHILELSALDKELNLVANLVGPELLRRLLPQSSIIVHYQNL